MESLFLTIFNMSITASYIVLAVILLRAILKKAPKALRVIMWAVVGVRLICPFSIESILSLIPSADTIPQNIIYSATPAIDSGISYLNQTLCKYGYLLPLSFGLSACAVCAYTQL